MKLASQFVVPAAPDKVFALFFDAATMRECIPGCEDLRQVDENTYQGNLVNEVAHVRFRAGFTAQIQSVTQPDGPDEPAEVKALLKGEDRRLGSTIKVDARMKVTPKGEESLVDYDLEMAMWGKLGRLGEAVIRRRSIEVERQFAETLAAVCAGQPVPRPESKKRREAAPQPQVTTNAQAAPTASSAPEMPVAAAPQYDERRPDHTRDLPFVVAVAAAAFFFGVVIGSRRRRC